ncbi:hypothetical protein FXO38_36831 [Capsicum annuum]|nr:hypothetical protein FXO38_36831 [Capsicum annuum]
MSRCWDQALEILEWITKTKRGWHTRKMGLENELDTLCGQSYGAKQYHMVGRILVLLGQDLKIAADAGSYERNMIPTIYAYGFILCHIRFLQAQNIVLPMMFSTGITTLLHIFTCWILVFKSGLGNKGAALANAISYRINFLLLATYMSEYHLPAKALGPDFQKRRFIILGNI